jgi:hypothetical protein
MKKDETRMTKEDLMIKPEAVGPPARQVSLCQSERYRKLRHSGFVILSFDIRHSSFGF